MSSKEGVVEAVGSFAWDGSRREVEMKLSGGGGELGAIDGRLVVSEVSGPYVDEVWCKSELTSSVYKVLTCRRCRSFAEDTSRDEFQS